ncbi:YacL [Parelusimicrobium proximum]
MPLWLFRLSTLVMFPFITYTFISHDKIGFYAGLACALLIVCTEFFFKKLRLVKIMIALFGTMMGYFLFVICQYVIAEISFAELETFWTKWQLYIEIGLMAVGALLCILRSDELEGINKKGRHLKVLDGSAIMDGRILDLIDTNFLSGILVIPQFVLNDLKELAEDRDPLESAKGRRGLDVISRLQEQKIIPLRITNKDFEATTRVEKIVKLAKYFGGEIVTLDFNVNKIASLHEVIVLNIRDLSTALKPVVLPGESMSLFVMKDGKEKEQGISYLDDGTMVVIEDGRKHVGKRVEVAVYSILQTSAGRMIFARTK